MTSKALMTVEELAALYDLSVSTIKANFSRVQNTIARKYGATIAKEGRGAAARYYIQNQDYADPSRAVSLYQSIEHNILPAKVAARLLDINFLIFIGIVSSPQRAFRGSYYDLLNYLEIDTSEANVAIARRSLQHLSEQNYIMYMEDDSDTLYFMAGIKKVVETKMELEIKAIRFFQRLVQGTRKNWIPLMKVYLSLHFLQQPCTIKEIAAATELSEYKVKDSLSILEKNNVILKKIINAQDAVSGEFYCLGSQINVNAFGVIEE